MSFEEKSNIVVLAIVGLVYGGYFVLMFGFIVPDTSIAEINWQPVMLLTAIPVAVLAVVTHIPLALASPGEATANDERDRSINVRGEALGGIVLGVGAMAGLVVTMLELDWFWIAHVLLAALVLSELAAAVRKIWLYRRGL